tara:strand:- start:9365 stop:10399 length:1035 start_codon:yes stop_codon:yes gene_type:complete
MELNLEKELNSKVYFSFDISFNSTRLNKKIKIPVYCEKIDSKIMFFNDVFFRETIKLKDYDQCYSADAYREQLSHKTDFKGLKINEIKKDYWRIDDLIFNYFLNEIEFYKCLIGLATSQYKDLFEYRINGFRVEYYNEIHTIHLPLDISLGDEKTNKEIFFEYNGLINNGVKKSWFERRKDYQDRFKIWELSKAEDCIEESISKVKKELGKAIDNFYEKHKLSIGSVNKPLEIKTEKEDKVLKFLEKEYPSLREGASPQEIIDIINISTKIYEEKEEILYSLPEKEQISLKNNLESDKAFIKKLIDLEASFVDELKRKRLIFLERKKNDQIKEANSLIKEFIES